MKLYKIIIPLILIIVAFANCEHDKLDSYSGKEQVYFKFADQSSSVAEAFYNDSLYIPLGYDEVPRLDSLINIPVKIMGYQKDYVRPVNFTLLRDSSSAILGEDIELVYEKSFIPANSIEGFIQVKIKNTEKIKTNTLVAVIQTMPNDHFFADYDLTANDILNKKGKIKGNVFRILFDAKKDKPNLWAYFEPRFFSMFKAYSNTKLEFMCNTLGMERSYFEYDSATEDPNVVFTNRITKFSTVWTRILVLALADYERENNGPLIDENGNQVSFIK